MTNQEAKRKALREAYGEVWDKVERHVNDDGWIRFIPIGIDRLDVRKKGGEDRYRLKTLQGIEHNNGWNRIDGPASLPPEDGTYTVLGKSGKIEDYDYDPSKQMVWLEYFTHWRRVTKIDLPIY